jgi:deazaflavin-dependent oxidoreductase (nitroreductase family)
MPVDPFIIKTMGAIHEFWYRLTGGVLGGSIVGRPILLLTTTGRKTGVQRTAPLLYLEDEENLIVIASNGGNPRHPAWWLNLEKNPQAEVRLRNEKRRVRAEEATGEERERLWRAVVETYSGYEGYQKATDRQIPVVILRPEAKTEEQV